MDELATQEDASTQVGELVALPSPTAQAAPSAVDVFAQDAALAPSSSVAEQDATADETTDPAAQSAETEGSAADQSASLLEGAPRAGAQQDDHCPPPAPIPFTSESATVKTGDCDAAAIEPAEPSATVAQEGAVEVMLVPAPPVTLPESEPADKSEVAEEDLPEEEIEEEDLDELAENEEEYSEPSESPAPSPLPSPSRDGFGATEVDQPVLDMEAVRNGDAPLIMDLHSAEDFRLEATSPFSTSVNGPGCSTAEDMPETPTSYLDSPVHDGGDNSIAGSPICCSQAELESPRSAAREGDADMTELSHGSPTLSNGAPLSVNNPASPESTPGSPPVAENGSLPSPPLQIASARSKKPAAATPPPAPTAAKKQAKTATARLTTAPGSRLPASKRATADKATTKPTSTPGSTTQKPSSASATARTENPKKPVAAKTATAKKGAPKAVVYSISPAARPKRTVPVQSKSEPANEASPASPTESSATDGGAKAEIADSDQDASKAHPKRVSKAKSEAASNRLYEDAKAAKLRKEARSAEVDEACTFAPKVTHTSNGPTKRPSLGEVDRFAALHEEAKQLQAKKLELQRKHEEATYTFRPTITSKAKKLARETARPRYENLYMQAREMKQKREEKALAKKKEDEEQCSFKPKIKATKSPVQTKPLYDAEREKQKQLLLEQKRKEVELSKCTFKPKVLSKKPSAKAETNGGVEEEGKIYDRLYRAGKVQAERIERLRKEREDEEKSKAPFQPQLVATSHKTKEGDAQQKEPFHKRLYKKDHMQKLSAEREQQKLEEERQFSFKPKISEIPEEIKAKQKEYTSPDKPIFERLYEEKERIKEKLQASEEERAQKEMAECTFRPRVASLSVSSNGSAPTSPVWERLSICHKSQTIEEREKLKHQLEMQGCTFKPVISPSEHVSPYRSPSYLSRRRSSRSESCSPSFDIATRKASAVAPRSSPDSRASVAQFQPVSIGNILKSSTLVLAEEKSPANDPDTPSPPASAPPSTAKSSVDGSYPSSALDSPRRPSPVHEPAEVHSNGGVKSADYASDVMSAPLPLARSLDAEFQAEESPAVN